MKCILCRWSKPRPAATAHVAAYLPTKAENNCSPVILQMRLVGGLADRYHDLFFNSSSFYLPAAVWALTHGELISCNIGLENMAITNLEFIFADALYLQLSFRIFCRRRFLPAAVWALTNGELKSCNIGLENKAITIWNFFVPMHYTGNYVFFYEMYAVPLVEAQTAN